MENIQQLQNIPLFQSITEDDLKKLAKQLRQMEANSGQVIISEGEVGDCLFIITRGKAKVVAEVDDNDEPITLSYLVSGDYFGEMSLITGEPRSATVIAQEDCSLLQLDKSAFDELLMNNPTISLNLTHMLSHRLSLSNKARESSEKYYKKRIKPRGSLEEVDLIKLLKYAEENSLTGVLRVTNGEREAQFNFRKGQLENLQFEDFNEDQAMDELLGWETGTFVIEPQIFNLQASENESGHPDKVLETSTMLTYFERYLMDKFGNLIKFAGARSIQAALNKSHHKFSKYFEAANEIQISTEPRLTVNLHKIENWTEKHTLYLAILMRDIVHTLSYDLLGMDFWELHSNDKDLEQELQKSQYYVYYDQALDFIRE